MKLKTVFLLMLASMLTLSIAMSGCRQQEGRLPQQSQTSASPAVTSAQPSSVAADPQKEDGEHPYWITQEKLTLTMFAPFDQKSSQVMPDYSGKEITAMFEEYTNIKIEYQLPPVGQEKEQLNLLLASATLPDMIYAQMANITGGGQYLMSNGLIIPATDLVEEHMPKFKEIIGRNPVLDKQLRLDNGDLYFFPCIRESRQVQTHGGAYMRKDWLDQLGLGLPETIGEIYTALSGFKSMDASCLPFVPSGFAPHFLSNGGLGHVPGRNVS